MMRGQQAPGIGSHGSVTCDQVALKTFQALVEFHMHFEGPSVSTEKPPIWRVRMLASIIWEPNKTLIMRVSPFPAHKEPREKLEAPSWPSKEQRVWVLRTLEKSNLHSLVPLQHVEGKFVCFCMARIFLQPFRDLSLPWNSMILILWTASFKCYISIPSYILCEF